MRAYKFTVQVGSDRTVRVTLPADAGEGSAEVIVLASDRAAGELGPDQLDALLDELEQHPWNRERAEIDRELAAERADWD